MIRAGVILAFVLAFGSFTESAITSIDPNELEAGIKSGFFGAVVDVRTMAEFKRGHIPNSTLVESLNRAGTSSEVTNASALAGCKQCNVAIYCRSGARALGALRYLQKSGFESLFNAGGINDWKRFNKSLVNVGSVDAPCTEEPEETCEVPTDAPSDAPSTPTEGVIGLGGDIPPKKIVDDIDDHGESKVFENSDGTGVTRGGLPRRRRMLMGSKN